MIIKKFQGKTEEEAIEAAKKELGESLVIMNVKEVRPKGLRMLWTGKYMEVTAALESEREMVRPATGTGETSRPRSDEPAEHSSMMKPVLESSQNIEKKLDSLQTFLQTQMQGAEQSATDEAKEKKPVEEGAVTEKADKKEKTGENGERDKTAEEQQKFIRLIYNTMLDNEVDEKYANAILEDVEKTKNPNLPIDAILANVYQKMILKFGKAEGIRPSGEGASVVFFVGPTGVGKTTTIAKIASTFSIEQKKKVALLTADTYRIAATEQLRTYANIMEVPFRIIYSGEELKNAIADFKDFDYIFVDTTGHSHQNGEQMDNTRELLETVKEFGDYQAFLVLSATTKYRDLLNIAKRYSELTKFQLIFTKLDETTTFGNLLNVKLFCESPIAFVTNGQNVPDDIEQFDAQKTVKLLLGGKQTHD